MHKCFQILLTGLVLLLCRGALAASDTFGPYTVHYTAVPSNFIDPAIAEQYDIVRGPRRAFLNISILRATGGDLGRPVTATVTGTMSNLLGQSAPIDFVEVREGNAIYYLGQFVFSNAETVTFDVEFQPEGGARSWSFSWSTEMYAN